jgi:hypothetical protein
MSSATTIKRWPALLAVVLLLGACADGRDASQTHAPPAPAAAEADPDLAAHSQGVLDAAVEADKPGCFAAVRGPRRRTRRYLAVALGSTDFRYVPGSLAV